MKKLLSIAASIFIIASAYAQRQQPTLKEINQLKASGAIPKEMQIVKFVSSEIHQNDNVLNGLKKVLSLVYPKMQLKHCCSTGINLFKFIFRWITKVK